MSNFYFRGDNIFLYVKFKNDNNELIDVENPIVKIRHDRNGDIIEDLIDFQLVRLNKGEYFANYLIDYDADYSNYEVTYIGYFEGKEAKVVEEFRVIPKSNIYENTIKIYGFVNQLRTGYPLIGVDVEIISLDNNDVVFSTYTKIDGTWEANIYPGEYIIKFNKFGFISQEITFQIGLEHNSIQFENVSLELENSVSNGNGIYLIEDKYVTREGMPIEGLLVKAFSILNLNEMVGQCETNDEGKWSLFLDPGIYLLKVTGNIFDDEFDQTFRLKISDEGHFSFENLNDNVATLSQDDYIDNGNGSVHITDVVIDNNGNPIIDVQVNAFIKGNLNKIIAQDYTDPSGRWNLFLDPGTYTIEYYHPEFDSYMEDRVINN